MKKLKVQLGSTKADDKYFITVLDDGPYLVHGRPPMTQQIIVKDEEGQNWDFKHTQDFDMDAEPVALCRCGTSKTKPYCDGAHVEYRWNPELTASERPLLEEAELFKGPETGLSLTDNPEYCIFARFCDAKGRIWKIVKQSDDPEKREIVIHEASLCAGGRLSAWDNETQKPIEPKFDPSLVLIEDTPLRVSGGVWVRGGIPIVREDGFVYEIRNRVTLCRCGESTNKPHCDGAHATVRFKDGLYKEERE